MNAPKIAWMPISSVAYALTSTPTSSSVSRGAPSAPSPRARTRRARPGRTTANMTAAKAAVSPSVTIRSRGPPARTIATTTARMSQATTSWIAAQARLIAPTGLRESPFSLRILASTGKAVIDSAAPTNSTKPRRSMPGASVSWTASAIPTPSRNGSSSDRPDTNPTVRPLPRMWAGSSSRPTRNMKKISPSWAIVSSEGMISSGNSQSCAAGEIAPRMDGPRAMPAMISPMTGGWCTRAIARPARRAATTTTATAMITSANTVPASSPARSGPTRVMTTGSVTARNPVRDWPIVR